MQDHDNRVDEVLRHSRAIKSETSALIEELREAGADIKRTVDLKGRMERHPYATMAVAAGVGYVLGGGVFTRLTARALRIGARALFVPMLRSQLAALGESFVANRGAYAGGSEDGQGGL